MLFNLSRVILWLIISTLAIFKIRTSKIVRKKLISILTVVLCMALLSISAMFPVENLFFNFKSPESVFHYAGSGEVDDIIFGKNSCMILYSQGSSEFGFYIIPKTEKGYKIPGYFATKKISHKFDRNGNFDVFQVTGTNDYYIYGTFISKDREIAIFDSNNKPVDTSIVEMDNQSTKAVSLYTYVENFTDEYFLLINDEKVFVSH